jgi:hypothetical protein
LQFIGYHLPALYREEDVPLLVPALSHVVGNAQTDDPLHPGHEQSSVVGGQILLKETGKGLFPFSPIRPILPPW